MSEWMEAFQQALTAAGHGDLMVHPLVLSMACARGIPAEQFAEQVVSEYEAHRKVEQVTFTAEGVVTVWDKPTRRDTATLQVARAVCLN